VERRVHEKYVLPLPAGSGAVSRSDVPVRAGSGAYHTLYVSDLIALDTVNTMPEKTLKSYADHGRPGKPIQKTYDEAPRS